MTFLQPGGSMGDVGRKTVQEWGSFGPKWRTMSPQSNRAAQGIARGASVPLLLLWWMPCLPPLWQALFPEAPDLIVDPGVGISSASRLQFAILALLALAFSGWRPQKPSLSSPGLWLSLFLGWSALSAWRGGDPLESLLFVLGWVAAAAVLWAAPSALPVQAGMAWRNASLYGPLLVTGLISLEPALRSPADFRAAGPFQLPGTLANWLLLVLPLAISALLRADRRELPWALIGTTFGAASLALTVSRAAWLAGLIGLVLLLLLEAQSSGREIVGWGLFGLAGLLLLVAIRQHLGGMGLLGGVALLAAPPLLSLAFSGRLGKQALFRLVLLGALTSLLVTGIGAKHSLGELAERRMASLTGADDSAAGRIHFWRAALELSLHHPLLGVGPDRFSEAYPAVQEHYYYFSDSAHGTVVELLSEVGWVGTILLGIGLGLYLAKSAIAPATKPWQRAPLVGLAIGGLYSQFEIGYHFAVMWTSAAFVLALLRGDREPAPPTRSFSPWPLPLLALVLLIFPFAREYELSTRQTDPQIGYRMAREVSDRLPIWGRPALTALSLGVASQRDPSELEPLVARALKVAPEDAATYQIAAEVDRAMGRWESALANDSRALQRDRFNRPSIYRGLLATARSLGDQELYDKVVRDALAIYDLDKGWSIAHPGHRQKLATELRPMLYDIADGVDPQREPARTEPIYRFLSETAPAPEARALFGWGMSLYGLGEPTRARELLEKAHQLDPVYPLPERVWPAR